jgi:sucrose-6-phosphate hydrolase SacC (GH32 family)
MTSVTRRFYQRPAEAITFSTQWMMIFSEGLHAQHLAWASSSDLFQWKREGCISIPRQSWMARKYGAPFVWQEEGRWFMILMGEENGTYHTSLGLLYSSDGLTWNLCPERE